VAKESPPGIPDGSRKKEGPIGQAKRELKNSFNILF
jgi:hypothetical protein